MKKIFLIGFFLTGISFYGQEIKTKTTSALGDNIAYFIKNKLATKEELIVIQPDEIESVNVVKRDTVIDKKRYASQIFVQLKPTRIK